MKIATQRTNSSAIKMLLLIVSIIAAVYVGYLLYSNYKANSQQTVNTSAEDVQTAPTIAEPTDLEEAATTIDEAEVESNNMDDMTEIDKELSSF
jgi:uncharacterized membrane protein YebE (DUF533 family)